MACVSPWPLVVFEWRSAFLEERVALQTPRTTHGLISIRTSYHLKSLRSRFAEFHAEFDVCSLLQVHVHAEIANVTAHVVTNTRVVQLPMFTQRRHSACWVVTFRAPKHSHSFMYCHRLAVYGTSLETFWYTLVLIENGKGCGAYVVTEPTWLNYQTARRHIP
jgi:hypothetical protein